MNVPLSAPTVHFVLLCHARTGSNLVLRSLEQHPEIRMLGEVFHPNEASRRENALQVIAKNEYYRTGEDGAAYLEREVFLTDPPPPVRACGFKQFFDYARDDVHMRASWDYLAAHRELRIIRLTRRNLLESLISLHVAEKTDQWVHPGPLREWRRKDLDPFVLDSEACRIHFDYRTRKNAWADDVFRDHPTLRLEYESDLEARFPDAMSRIFEFLDVAHRPAKPRLRKQRTKTPAQQLANYEELRRYFRDTPYAAFFE